MGAAVNVDTGQFQAIVAQVAELAERVVAVGDEAAATRRVAGVFYDAGYADAGGVDAARKAYRLGWDAGQRRQAAAAEVVPARGPRHARPGHLRVVR